MPAHAEARVERYRAQPPAENTRLDAPQAVLAPPPVARCPRTASAPARGLPAGVVPTRMELREEEARAVPAFTWGEGSSPRGGLKHVVERSLAEKGPR